MGSIAVPALVEAHLRDQSLTEGQVQGVMLVATTRDRFIAWQGVAGAGKSYAHQFLAGECADSPG